MVEGPAATGGADANLAWAGALVRGLAQAGVTEYVISPGSRSTPLALAAEIDPDVRSWVLPDERSAAFMALGLARGRGRPAGLIGTSGTAVANWLPAVVEADADRVPLVVISADRPPELHDTGANQTIRQDDLFDGRTRMRVSLAPFSADGPGLSYPRSVGAQAAQRAVWPDPGPVHINAMFREPLVPTRLPETAPHPVRGGYPDLPRTLPGAESIATLAERLDCTPSVIVAGRLPPSGDHQAAIARLAQRLACPILADPLSGLRWCRHDRSRVITSYDTFLRSPRLVDHLQPQTILQFGAAPTSRVLQQFMGRTQGHLWLAAAPGPWPDPGRRAAGCLTAEPAVIARLLEEQLVAKPGADWLAGWRSADTDGMALIADPDCRPAEADVIGLLESHLPDGASLFIGNSMPVRLLDTFGTRHERTICVFGNRGASGIDGNVATLAGLARGATPPVTGLIGDLALVHDMNGLLALRETDATLLVINNGGGGIFELLAQRELASFERLWLTPTGLEPGKIAGLYGIRHRRCATPETLAATLSDALDSKGADLLEISVDRETSSHALRSLWARAAAL